MHGPSQTAEYILECGEEIGPRGEMDIITGFEPVGGGSIPSEGTKLFFSIFVR